jgi:hypothetical protein
MVDADHRLLSRQLWPPLLRAPPRARYGQNASFLAELLLEGGTSMLLAADAP